MRVEANELITIHGLSYDRKGIASGYDYSETSLSSIDNVTHRLHIVDDIQENEAIITLKTARGYKGIYANHVIKDVPFENRRSP